jgi:phosphate transport system substrate-binding protein
LSRSHHFLFNNSRFLPCFLSDDLYSSPNLPSFTGGSRKVRTLGPTGDDHFLELAVENPNEQSASHTATPVKRRFSALVIFVIVAIAALVVVGIYIAPRYFIDEQRPKEYPRLQLGGTSTIFVIVENRWKGKYRDEKGVEVGYESTGSTTGVSRLIDGTYAIAFTHGPLSPEQRDKAREKGGDVVHVPILLCGVAPIYNVKELKGKPPLKLSGKALADIFLGNIKTWDDPALKLLNPGVELPPTKITVVHREDSSGTTQIFTEYLDAVSAGAWREKAGAPASEAKWPVGVAAPRNLGVATRVSQTEGAIGYVDRMFTSYNEMALDYAAIENKDKTAYVRAEPENMTAAATAILADIPDDLGFHLTNRPGKEAYPISGVIYAVCYQKQPDEKRKQVIDFLHWATHEGQPHAAKMTFAPLPPELVKRIDQKLETIK